MNTPIKITLVEPSIIVRSGILVILKQLNTLHIEVFEADDVMQLKNSIGWQSPDVLMIDTASVGRLALQQIKKEANGSLKYVALQNSLTDQNALTDYDEVISLYDSIEQIKAKLTNMLQEPESDKRHESLSVREKEVMVCVIKGMTNKQIADTLCISAHTVITHRRNISAKLQIHSTAGLTIYAIVNKLVALDDVKSLVSDDTLSLQGN
ncbi:MAG: LuxR C-terminal-related transcriptional regulator [Prevotellaceae bacterium]|jgi:DNA-binding NarL/FixJ family response regulator|nr:LuxR C-terminal-related transcriptional regulator [Prevotellaceae bacterium]